MTKPDARVYQSIKNFKDARAGSEAKYPGQYMLKYQVFPGAELYYKTQEFMKEEKVMNRKGELVSPNESQAITRMMRFFFEERAKRNNK